MKLLSRKFLLGSFLLITLLRYLMFSLDLELTFLDPLVFGLVCFTLSKDEGLGSKVGIGIEDLTPTFRFSNISLCFLRTMSM